MSKRVVPATVLSIFLPLLSPCADAQVAPAAPAPSIKNYPRLPLAFERLQGGPSAGAKDRYIARGQSYTIGIENAKATIALNAEGAAKAVSLEFAGSHPANAVPGSELPGKVNYIRGNDPKKWQLGLQTYGRVTYPEAYPGIDVVYYGNQQQLEFDLVIKPGADPGAIRLKVAGADQLSIDGSGALRLGPAAGDLRVALPQIYQEVNGKKKSVPGHYAILSRNEVAFKVDSWDRARALVIDPTIIYSTLFGGGLGSSIPQAIKLDSQGNILIAGYTYPNDFPTFDPPRRQYGSTDAFITKLNPAGTALIYSTYLGGSGHDNASSLAVDSAGADWVAGSTGSGDFPVLNAAQPVYSGNSDAFVAKLNSAGVLQFSTFLGGSGIDYGYGVAVDVSGNGYVTGSANAYATGSANGPFPTTGGVIQAVDQGGDGFVTKYAPAGTVVYSTLLGGFANDVGYGIAVDSGGNAYVTGDSYSFVFNGAPAGGAQATNHGGQHAFVAKLNANATALLYFTFLGGTGSEQGRAIALDSPGNAYIAGQTTSTGLATGGAAQTALAGGTDGFVAKLNPSGSLFTYITYLGGNREDFLYALAVDAFGNAIIAGSTTSADFPTASAVQPALPGNGVSLFTSLNSGFSWEGSDLNMPGAVWDVSLNPAGSSGVIVTESGFYRTVNGGGTWTQQLSGSFGAGVLTRSPVAPGTIYAGQNGAIYRSVDDGVTWSFRGNPGLSSVPAVIADPVTANTVYAFSSSSPYVTKSTDGGATWTMAATGLPAAAVNSMVATSDGALYAGTYRSGIYKSTNQGTLWTAVNTGLPSNSVAYRLQSLTASGTTVYFAYANTYKTTNGGSSWVYATPIPFSVSQVAASPQNASILYVVYDNSVRESLDGGLTWNAGTGLPANVSYLNVKLVVDPANSAHVLAVTPVSQSVFVAKLNSTGSALLWSTYLGDTSTSQAYGVTTDGAGNAFVTGYTDGGTFPVTSVALPSGTSAAFLTKISDVTAACSSLTVSPVSVVSPKAGGILTFSVVAPSGCAWTASVNQPWATITVNASGIGSAILTKNI